MSETSGWSTPVAPGPAGGGPVPARGVPRADPLAAVVTVLGGVLGILQLLLSWTSVAPSVGLPIEGGVTGWNVFRSAQAAASLSVSSAVSAYSVVGVGVAGGAVVLLGLALLTPVDHRPLGAVALLLSLGMVAAAVWWLARAHSLLGRSLGQVFSVAGPGWYLFLVAGLVGVGGAAKALAG
ncbi:hypothetical protein [Nakamurella endophytica]|uniref:Uncharacterized protein n=1 Tax=Nakamurella endophytica TaxID=1748367 RepID=A0A917T5J1_9ACTN|nr:hypothetical protein [Nakamurella endophytica]GGM11928.1 hypothetical protein GCM10011594_34740 [Nakamurella endophytica]